MRPPKTTKSRRQDHAIENEADAKAAALAAPEESTDSDGEYGRVEIRMRVADLLSQGYSLGRVVEDLMEPEDRNGFGVSRKTAWRYLDHVRQKWREQEQADRPFQRARLIHIQELGIREAFRDRHWGGFNGGLKNLMDLLGLKLTKIEVQSGGMDALIEALKATPAQRENRIAELEALGLAESSGAVDDPSRTS